MLIRPGTLRNDVTLKQAPVFYIHGNKFRVTVLCFEHHAARVRAMKHELVRCQKIQVEKKIHKFICVDCEEARVNAVLAKAKEITVLGA